MHVVLYQPLIPPNTGCVARTCAATRTPLHLIEPLGFSITDKHLKRAGLDYWEHVQVTRWPSLEAFLDRVKPPRLVPTSSGHGEPHHGFAFAPNDALLFGPEDTGLPAKVFQRHGAGVRIPIWGRVRSLNLSTAVGIVLYEAFRRTGGLDGHQGEERQG